MAHTSFYRTYRPATFADMVGQKHIERTLKNAVATDQVAHAYLFSGPRGTGKTTTARILAAALLCEHPSGGEPDGTCEQCQEVAAGTHPDVIELDAASRTGVDNVRDEIIARVQFAPVRGRSKIYIIDEVHMLSTGAFNAFLKTLEEPPSHVVFILCTTDPQKVPETIRSRCQQFDFRPYAVEELTDQLKRIGKAEGITAEPEALALIAARARGGMRDAITSFEQLAAFTDNNITTAAVEETLGGADASSLATLVRIVATADTPASFTWVADQVNRGADLPEVVHALIDYVRDLYVLQVLGAQPGVIDRSEAEQQRMGELLALLSGPEQIAHMLDLLAALSAELRWANEPRTLLELALVRMTRPESELSLSALSQRLEALEKGSGSVRSGSDSVERVALANELQQSVGGDAPSAPPVEPGNDIEPGNRPVGRVDSTRHRSESQQDVALAPEAAADPLTAPAPTTDAGRLWREVLAQIKKTTPSRYAVFAEAELELDPQGGYILSYPSTAGFQLSQAKTADYVALLNTASEQACGQPLNPRYLLREEPHLPGMPRPEVTVDDIPDAQPAPDAQPEPSALVTPPDPEEGCDVFPDQPGEGDEYPDEQPPVGRIDPTRPMASADEHSDEQSPVGRVDPTRHRPEPQSAAAPAASPAAAPAPTLQATPVPVTEAGVAPKDASAIFAELGALPLTGTGADDSPGSGGAPEPATFGFDTLMADEYEGSDEEGAPYVDDPGGFEPSN